MEDLGYPKVDSGLRLLMLAHRWIEEAPAPGDNEPRLEFREEPSRLTIRVTGTGSEQGLFYEGAESVGVMRSLSADGYVELDYDEAEYPAGTGTITITDKGLKRIRYRRAFESNLPRFFEGWDVSLIGSPRHVGVWKEWRANWEGRSISVENRRYLFLGGRRSAPTYLDEFLYLDRQPAPGYRVVKSRFSKDLYCELRAADGVHEVRARIGPTKPWLKTGCLIAIDGVVIGGDLYKRFLTYPQ